MRVRLKYALPIAQMGLAAALWWCANRWQLAATAMQGPSSPAFDLLLIISWPVVPVRMLWFWHTPYLWDEVASIASIGMFWYWVALNIETLRERGMVLMFKWAPLRIAGDLLLITVGVFLGLLCTSTVIHGPPTYFPRLGPEWLWLVPTVAMEFIWSASLIFIFGRDAIYCVLRKKPMTASPADS
jgi:hypothetical protein